MATIKQYIDVFGKECLADVLNFKMNALLSEIEFVEKQIYEHKHGAGKKEFQEIMVTRKVPMEEWIIYKTLFDWRLFPLDVRLKELRKEYRNILPVWQALNNISPNREEDFTIKVERAKQYPIENMYRGEVRRTGKRISGKCPFHADNSPSFFIFLHDNHFHCFGCGANGDAIDFYMRQNTCDFKTAVNSLC